MTLENEDNYQCNGVSQDVFLLFFIVTFTLNIFQLKHDEDLL